MSEVYSEKFLDKLLDDLVNASSKREIFEIVSQYNGSNSIIVECIKTVHLSMPKRQAFTKRESLHFLPRNATEMEK